MTGANEERGLKVLDMALAHMSALVECQLAQALDAFERRDVGAAIHVIEADERIDERREAIEGQAIEILAGGVSDAASARKVVTAMKIAGELERIGDLSKNVARRMQIVSREPPASAHSGVVRLGRAALRQTTDALNALTALDACAAGAVWRADAEIDELHNAIFRELLEAMAAESAVVAAGAHLVFIAKNFERVGDHATNIAESVHFLATGSQFSGGRPKLDRTASMVLRRVGKER